MIDADTGAKLKEFDLSSVNGGRGVAADVFVVPDGNTGHAKWAYAIDLGGNVWRISGATANVPFARPRTPATGRSPASPRWAATPFHVLQRTSASS